MDDVDEADDQSRGEADVSAEVGSATDMDLINEDLLRDGPARATGFVRPREPVSRHNNG